MLVATYVAAALICAFSLVLGRALVRLLRRPATTWFEGPVGLATLLAVCAVAIRLPHRATTTLVILALILAASLVYLRGEALPQARTLRIAGPVVLLTLLVASLPFIASGHVGPLGIGVNNDLAGHLHYAAWLEDPTDDVPTTITYGYPLGPHGLAAAIAKGTGMEPLSAMLGLILAIPVLTAIAALALLRELRPGVRTIAATLAALPYLAASTLAIAGFKETIMALLVIGFALCLRELSIGIGDRRGLLLAAGLIGAGMLGVYSYPGVVYAAAIFAIWGGLEILAAWRRGKGSEIRATVRRAAPMVAVPIGVLLLMAVAVVSQIADFRHSVSIVQNVNSRLKEAVSPLEALGSWPSGDFLAGTGGLDAYLVFGALGVIALVVGVASAIARRERALLAGLAAAVLIYVATLIDGGFYVQAKGLAIIAPIAMLIAIAGLLGAWALPQSASERSAAEPEGAAGAAPPSERRRLFRPRIVLAAVFLAVAAYSTFLALRDAHVAPPEYQAAQLDRFRSELQGKRVLSLTTDRYTDYYLRGAEVRSPAKFAEETILPRAGKFERLPVDFDSVVPAALDRFDYAITTTATYKSSPPPNWEQVDQTADFLLWRRIGRTPMVGILPEEERPGSLYDCDNPKLKAIVDRAIAQGYRTARVQPMSRVGKRLFWQPGSAIGDGDRISQSLELPPGRWQLSLQYYSPVLDVTVEADGLQAKLPPTADSGVRFRTAQGAFWPVGPVTSTGAPIKVTISASGLSWLQKLLGVDQTADIGNVTAARPEDAREVPLRRACGLYVDHYTVGPG